MKKQATDGLSMDWSKYNQPSDTLKFLNNISGLKESDLSTYGVVQLNIGDLKCIINENSFPIKIKHDPNPPEQPDNDGHILLMDILLSGNVALVKERLAEIASWAPNMKPKE